MSSDAELSDWLSDLVLKVKAVTDLNNALVLEDFEQNYTRPQLKLNPTTLNLIFIFNSAEEIPG